jgi:hypothetical protein
MRSKNDGGKATSRRHRVSKCLCWGIHENPSPSKRRVLWNSWNKFLGVLNLRSSGILNLRGSGIVNLWSSEIANLWRSKAWTCEARSRELVKIWNLEPVKPWVREPVRIRSHEPAKPRKQKSAKFGNLLKFEFRSHDVWRFPGWGDSRISGKPSQRRRLKKFGIGVWTSGRLVNVWHVKDIHVHVHTRNIPWVRGVFSECKSPFVSL